jgi:hypothetical protein
LKVPGGTIDIQRSIYNDGPRFYRDAWHFQHARTLEFDVKVWSFSGSSSGGSSSSGSSTVGRPIDTLVTTAEGSTITLKPIKREGIWFEPDPSKSNIDAAAGEPVVYRSADAPERIVYLGGDLWRWEDKYGNWETYKYPFVNMNGVQLQTDVTYVAFYYARQGKLQAYGDRQGVIARIIYDGNNMLTGIADRNDRQVFWFSYAVADSGNSIVTIRDLDDRQVEYEVSYISKGGCSDMPQELIHRFKDVNGRETFYHYGLVESFKWSETGDTGSSDLEFSSSSSSGAGSGRPR